MLHKLSLLAILLCFLQPANAQFQEGTALVPIESHILYDTLQWSGVNTTTSYTTWSLTDKVVNVITFKIDEAKKKYYASNFTAHASVTLLFTAFNGDTSSVKNVKFDLNYDSATGAKYTTRDYKTYKGYKEVKLTIDTLNIAGNTGWNPVYVLAFTNEILPVRYYNLSTTPADLLPSLTPSQPTSDVLQLLWNYPAGAHENMTQLEWAHVETDMLPFYNGNTSLLFQSNSSRIDLDEKVLDTVSHTIAYRFKIPLLYDSGKLYYRTRAVERKANGTLITGPWTIDSFTVIGHQPNLNWQSSITFAEQGKYKAVIQYFDGSLRGRQTVTKDNSTGNTIVGETIYDLQGRPNVQILPTPTLDSAIHYFTNFNRFNGMSPDDDPAKYFDLTVVKCDTTHSLNIGYGNGRYYSANNDWLTGSRAETKSKYIPDAQGYAFTETRFTDDATQRVKEQGGVGIDHQIKDNGHQTKYYYGKPSQPELDALFGTEAGDASHYSKNMVKDANGQLSVSYVDMHGRTVATALAGDPTSGIDSIINSTDYPILNATIKNDLLTPVTNIIQGNSIVSVSTILVDAPNTYTFTYKLTPAILQLLNCSSQPVCFDCKYNLEISIKGEDCNDTIPIIKRYDNLQMVTANNCDSSKGFVGDGITVATKQIDLPVSLHMGSYVIRKTLTINDSLFQIRRDSALKVLLCKTQDSIYHHIYDSLSVASGCGAPATTACDSCNAKLGIFSAYKTKYLTAIAPDSVSDAFIHAQYSDDSTECSKACGGNLNPQFSTLKGLRDQMLRDMFPFTGQYATDTIIKATNGRPDSTKLDAHYNIFTSSYYIGGTQFSSSKPYYKHPYYEAASDSNYYTGDHIIDTSVNLATITPSSFANTFQDSWASSLIIWHPEYSKLDYAEKHMAACYNWLDSMLSCTSYATALSKGYTVPVKISTSTINDPYFLLSGTSADMDTINTRLYTAINDSVDASGTHYAVWRGPSIWQVANSSVLCAATDSIHKYSCIMGTTATGLSSSVTAAADKDIVWNNFKTLYLSYRNELITRYINGHATSALSQADMDELTKHEGKQLIFAANQDIANQNNAPFWAGITNPHATDTTGLGHYIDSAKLDNCQGQVPLWRARLLQCDSLKNLLNKELGSDSLKVDSIIKTITDSLVMICHNSISSTQPYGASTVNPSYGGAPRSFEDVVNNVFRVRGIKDSINKGGYFCNPFSIDFPKPYGLNPQVAVNYTHTLDDCACKQYAILKEEAGTAANSFSTMNQFLRTNYNDTLTWVLWQGLQKCDTAYRDTCCTKAVINSTSLVPGSGGIIPNWGIKVTYQLPPHCDSCSIYMYKNGDLVTSFINICGTTEKTFFSITDTCAYYTFSIECHNKTCGLLTSDPAYYGGNCGILGRGGPIGLGCEGPIIDSVKYTDSTALAPIRVYFETSYSCNDCTVYMYDMDDNPVGFPQQICFADYLDFQDPTPCTDYYFVIVCDNDLCGPTQSDPAYYHANCGGNPCPPPVINSIDLIHRTSPINLLHITYDLPDSCDSCKIIMYDQNGNIFSTYHNICGTVDTSFIIYDVCANYKFVIKCYNATCGEMISDTGYYFNSCTTNYPCEKFTPITLSESVPLPAFFNCGYVKPCISCYKLVNVLTPEFRGLNTTLYSAVPYLDSITDDKAKKNALWARFLNYRTGFSKSVYEYMAAYKNCSADTPLITSLCAFDKPLNDPSDLFVPDSLPCKNVETQAQFITQLLFTKMKDSLLANFDSLYIDKCLGAQSHEQFYVSYKPKEYHYTLYYYDQAGNLVKTLPPAAVKPNYGTNYLDSVVSARNNSTDYVNYLNNTRLATQYRYNTLNQVIAQQTPDAGISHFWYDRLGRLVVSQNAQQILSNKYSYTLYDVLGRITQVGQKQQTQTISQDTTQNDVAMRRWLDDVAGGGSLKEQITRTVYDISYYNGETPPALTPILEQKNLRNRVSYTQIINQEPSDFATNDSAFVKAHEAATYYSYDIHGNVDTLLQDLRGAFGTTSDSVNRFKKIVYDYDLVSGKVNRVVYQPGRTDEFYHQYLYDDENRIISVQTSHDSIYWENEAAYEYYRHGPLSRTVLGENKIQGLDYAYTIQGWLKGVNSTSPYSGVYDMGHDGAPNGNGIARDAFGYSLNYFSGDYKPIDATVAPFVTVTNSLVTASDGVAPGKDLFNGNIRAMMVNVPKLGEAKLYGYRYDQLNRIKAMNSYNGFKDSINTFTGSNTPTMTEDYRERVTYDPNGNIKTYVRHGATSIHLTMDSLAYGYNFDGLGNLVNNRLRHVKDPVSSGNYTEDIDDQSDDNYTYDSIGNMMSDAQAGITAITWTVYGKIKTITKGSTTIDYTYDASGNRISKSVTVSGVTTKTIYVRDASGNVMSLYAKDASINSGAISQTEISMYGSSRLGVWNINRNVDNSHLDTVDYSSYSSKFIRGNKLFELSNHLGNVLTTISDKHIGVDSTGDSTVDYYKADVVTANDYYPFGMEMPGRKYSNGSGYRYGFNGQEKDKELNENFTTATYWEYDARIGRRWNRDPVAKEYESPYATFSNNPIFFSDPNGDDPDKPAGKGSKEGEQQTTSCFKIVGRGIVITKSVTWNWHAGGLKTGKTKKGADGKVGDVLTQEGWYTDEDYFKVLKSSSAADALGYQLVKSGLAVSNRDYNYGSGDEAELSKFIGTGLNSNASSFLIGASKSLVYDASARITGNIDYAGFNIEDMIGVGLLLKEGLKIVGTYALANLSKSMAKSTLVRSTVEDFVKLFKPLNEYDLTKTLYRGITGSEGQGSFIFLTDDVTVAASYATKNGQIMRYEISQSSIFNLEQRRLLTVNPKDMHMVGGKQIYHTTYEFSLPELRKALNQIGTPNK